VAPALAGLFAGAATLVLPRLGWLALVAGAAVTAILHDQAGVALVLALGGVLPMLGLVRSPSDWPLATAAPGLGMIGLAGGWPALAGRAHTVWRRAVLGALGWVWLLLAAPLAGRILYLSPMPGRPPRGVWASSAAEAVRFAQSLATSGVLAGAAVWALAAAVSPWLVGGRSRALDVARVGLWATLTAWGAEAAVAAAHGPLPAPSAPTVALGAVACAVITLGPVVAGGWRGPWHSPLSRARVP
ncbi:MAG: hypothetical protein WBQ18_08025, partial [Solirubrobacteraceae bacterium]